jgi:hypothetical protein
MLLLSHYQACEYQDGYPPHSGLLSMLYRSDNHKRKRITNYDVDLRLHAIYPAVIMLSAILNSTATMINRIQ